MAWWEATKKPVFSWQQILLNPERCRTIDFTPPSQELNWFKQSYTSWFLGEYVTEDGGLYTANPFDPVFIFFPIFEARMKVPKLPWCFNPRTYV
ncbi:hypothetical protein ACFX11_043556 [Malus domestica]